MLRLFESKGYRATPEFYKDMASWAVMHGEAETLGHFQAAGEVLQAEADGFRFVAVRVWWRR